MNVINISFSAILDAFQSRNCKKLIDIEQLIFLSNDISPEDRDELLVAVDSALEQLYDQGIR